MRRARRSAGRALSRSASAASSRAVIRPRYITTSRSATASSSSSSDETSSTAAPAVAGGDDAAVDQLGRADVDAARRLGRDQQPAGRPRAPAPRPPSADCRPRASPSGRCTDGARTSYSATRRVGEPTDGVEHPAQPAGERRPVVAREHQVVGQRVRQHQAVLVAVLRDVAHPVLGKLARARRRSGRRRGASRGRRGRRRRPVSASTSSVWPFPSTPAMPTISPARTVRSTPSTTTLPR